MQHLCRCYVCTPAPQQLGIRHRSEGASLGAGERLASQELPVGTEGHLLPHRPKGRARLHSQEAMIGLSKAILGY